MATESKNAHRKRVRWLEKWARSAMLLAAERDRYKQQVAKTWNLKFHVQALESQLRKLSEQYLVVCQELHDERHKSVIVSPGEWRVPS